MQSDGSNALFCWMDGPFCDTYRVSQKNGMLWKNGHNIKIQDICYQIGTEIFKIEEKMTEKMMPKVAYPPQQALRTRSCVLRIFYYS